MRILSILVLLAVPVVAQRADVHLDPAVTQINWTLGDVLHTVHGTFKLQKGDIWFDSATGQAGGMLIVDAASGQSGSSARDSRMHKNVLESAKFPQITFVPDRLIGTVSPAGDSDVQLHGVFTIHGGTHEMLMKVKSHMEPQKLTADIAFTVPYVKWGMKDPSNFLLKVKDFVDIDIHTTARVSRQQ